MTPFEYYFQNREKTDKIDLAFIIWLLMLYSQHITIQALNTNASSDVNMSFMSINIQSDFLVHRLITPSTSLAIYRLFVVGKPRHACPLHDDVIEYYFCPHYWPFVWWIPCKKSVTLHFDYLFRASQIKLKKSRWVAVDCRRLNSLRPSDAYICQ